MWLGGERGNAGDLLSFKPNTPHHWPGIVNPSNSCQAALSNLQKDKGGVEQHIGLSHLTSLSIMFAAVYHSQWTQWSHTPDWMRLHKMRLDCLDMGEWSDRRVIRSWLRSHSRANTDTYNTQGHTWLIATSGLKGNPPPYFLGKAGYDRISTKDIFMYSTQGEQLKDEVFCFPRAEKELKDRMV